MRPTFALGALVLSSACGGGERTPPTPPGPRPPVDDTLSRDDRIRDGLKPGDPERTGKRHDVRAASSLTDVHPGDVPPSPAATPCLEARLGTTTTTTTTWRWPPARRR